MSVDRLHALISPALRRRSWRVTASALVSALLDLAGIAVLIPLLLVVLDPGAVAQSPVLAWCHAQGRFTDPTAFTVAVCVGVLTITVAKNLLSLALTRYRSRFLLDVYADLSERMFAATLSRGLLWIREHHTVRLVNDINAVCYRAAVGVIGPQLTILTESLLLVSLVAVLCLCNPMLVVLAGVVFGPTGWLYYRAVRRRMERNGREENRLQVRQNRMCYEALRGYADIEIQEARPRVAARFAEGLRGLCRLRLRTDTMQGAAGRIVETGLVAGVVAILIGGLLIGQSGASLRVLLGVFVVAAYRIVPAVGRISSACVERRRNAFAVDAVAGMLAGGTSGTQHDIPESRNASGTPDGVRNRRQGLPGSREDASGASGGSAAPVREAEGAPGPRETACGDLSAWQLLRLEGVDFAYPGGRPVLEGVDLEIRRGERVGIRGVSGRGKSTLLNLIAGFFTPDRGAVTLDGQPLGAQLLTAWRRQLAYVSQEVFLADLPLSENIAFGVDPALIDRQRLLRAVDAASLTDWVATLPAGLDTVPGEAGCRISGGQRQRIGIARALYKEASLLLLDEATSSLDEATEEEIARALDRLAERVDGLTVILVSHRPGTLGRCDRIVEL